MTALLAFTPEQASRVTGLTRRQLRYWETTGFFTPRYTTASRSRFGRMYSFKDVVGLRTIAKLRDRLPLQELRRIGEWLYERYDEPWAALRFYVVGRSVVFEDPAGTFGLAGSDQRVLPIRLAEVERETSDAAASLTTRSASQHGKIVRNRYVQHNAWVLDGTRIPTSAVWDLHSSGLTVREIVTEYPRLTEQDVSAAVDFERRQRRQAG